MEPLNPYPRSANASPFDGSQYVLKRHLLKLIGARFSIYDAGGNQVLVAEQQGFKLKEAIRLHPYDVSNPPVLGIFARKVMDFSGAYDVVDLTTNEKIAVFKRKGWNSIVRDEWELLDPWDRPLGQMLEDNMMMALVRRFLTNLVPQNYDLLVGGQRQVDLKQNFNPFSYHLNVTFDGAPSQFDRRIGLAGAILLAAIEGREGG